MTKTDSVDNYREVTEAEKIALEKSDAAWERPPQMFIARWNVRSNGRGRYNEATGYFELNGIVDIGFDEAIDIDAKSTMLSDYIAVGSETAWSAYNITMRTCYPIIARSVNGLSLNWGYNVSIDVLRIGATDYLPFNDAIISAAYMPNCIELWPILKIDKCSNLDGFGMLTRLKECRLLGLNKNISFAKTSSLSIESLQFLIANASNSASIAISVHPDVYAKLTDESNEEWHQILLDAAEKQIQFATT